MELEERADIHPVCPHCDSQLGTMYCRTIRSMLGRRYVYFCANCRKILGVSHRKGFWMG